MAYRFRPRPTAPGAYRLASTVLSRLVALSDIRLGVGRGDGGIGTLDVNMGASTDPGIGNVEAGVGYMINNVSLVGTFYAPVESDVRLGIHYGADGTEFTGTLGTAWAATPLASDRATQAEIMLAIVQRLRERVDGLTDSTCFISDQRMPVSWPAGHLACTVVAGEGEVDDAMWTGGGYSTICEHLQIQITIWLRCMLDQIPRAEASLAGEEGMLSRFKPQLIRALLLEKYGGRIENWMPAGSDGLGLLRNPLQLLRCGAPLPDSEQKYLGMTLFFRASFDWRV